MCQNAIFDMTLIVSFSSVVLCKILIKITTEEHFLCCNSFQFLPVSFCCDLYKNTEWHGRPTNSGFV